MAGPLGIIKSAKKIASRKTSLTDPAGGENVATSSSSQDNSDSTGYENGLNGLQDLPGQIDGADAGNEGVLIPDQSSDDNTEPSPTASSAPVNWSGNEYALPPSEEMAKRVAVHHSLIRKITGFLIHPMIEPTLPTDAKIADLNTGTGVFLQHLSGDSKKQNYTLVGYDTMPEIFPGGPNAMFKTCVPRATFKEHDILHPYPKQDQDSFDSVHTSFLGPVLVAGQWVNAFDNMVSLAKPGGWIQWIDVNLSSRENSGRIYVSKPGSSKQFHMEMMQGIAELDKFFDEASGGKRLKRIALAHPEVQSVHEDVFNTAQLNEVRVEIDKLAVQAWARLLRFLPGLPTTSRQWDQDRVDSIVEGMKKEVEDGVYIPLEVYVVVAQKHGLKHLRTHRAKCRHRHAQHQLWEAKMEFEESQRALVSMGVELPFDETPSHEELYR